MRRDGGSTHGSFQRAAAPSVSVCTVSFVLLCLAAAARRGSALDNGEALTPMMGWNSWYAGANVMNESQLKLQAEALVGLGLRTAGFRYFNLDDGVIAPRCASYARPCNRSERVETLHPPPPTGGRLKNGSLWADPFRFSNGSLGSLSAHVHGLQLLFGVRVCGPPCWLR